MTKFFICGAFDPIDGTTGEFWFVLLVNFDTYHSGDRLLVKGKEYILGRRELMDRGEVVSYELIPRSEVLEL